MEIDSNQFLTRLIKNLLGIAYRCRYEPHWPMEFISQGCADITGYSDRDFISGKVNWGDIIVGTAKETVWTDISSRIEKDNSFQIEYQIKHRDGSTRWVWEKGCAVLDESGRIVAIEGYITDVTDRLEAEQALKVRELNYKELIDGMNDTVWVIALDGSLIDVNKSATTNLGYSKNELLSMGLFSIDRSLTEENIAKLIKSMPEDEIQVFETTHRTRSGHIFPVEIGSSLINYMGERAILSIARDITERRKTQDALLRSKEKLKRRNRELTKSNESIREINKELIAARQRAEESDRLKSAFLANMSHEIRTPMNSIVGFSETLLKPDLAAEKREQFSRILHTSCQHLLSIVNDVIDISKIETGQMAIHPAKVNINHVLRRLEGMFQQLDQAQNNKICTTFQLTDENAFIETDETKLSQVLSNLISNAIKFTQQGSIDVGYTRDGAMLEFFVRDQGVGISPEYHGLIFNRFQQADQDPKRKYSGTGLGLPISKAFIEMLGGRIWLESKLNKGATFYFTIPYKPVREEQELLELKNERSSMAGVKALVAEDEEANLILLSEFLEEDGIIVSTANDGIQVVERFGEDPNVHIILMDVSMPNMDGVTAMQEIKRMNPDIPIVALTAFGFSGDRQKYMAMGFDGYVSKPIDRDELMHAIAELIRI